jgi:superfamily II DNA or RNA helicase
MSIDLRPYQSAAIESVRDEWKANHKRTIVSMPTGTGKTWLFVFIIYMAKANGMRCLVLVNTDELVEQTVDKLNRVGVQCGVIKAHRDEWSRDVVVASIQTISKPSRLTNLMPNHFMVVITDECHYANSPSYQRVLWYFADSWHLGVTATPFRGDKKSLAGAGWDSVAYYYPLQHAIDDGWLCPVKFVRVDTNVHVDAVRTSKNEHTGERDFSAKLLEKTVNTPERNNVIVDASIMNLRGRRILAFCAGVEHAVDLANAYRRRSIEAYAVYGAMRERHRRLILKAHRTGRFPVLTNCQILTHGYDDPSLDAIVMARPTESKVLYMQEIGRGLRPNPQSGKRDCLVLDVVDVAKKHQLAIGSELVQLREMIAERNQKKLDGGEPEAPLVPEGSGS